MKAGRSLTDLAAELERQVASKRDFVADTRKLALAVAGDDVALGLDLTGPGVKSGMFLAPTGHCHRQLGERCGIPAKYYDRMRGEARELLVANVNHWLHTSPETRLIRALDGNARAFLSERYRPLDNYDLVEATLPRLIDAGADVVSCEVTDSRLYLKAVVPGRQEEIGPPGFAWGRGHDAVDVVQPGIVIANSEVGAGALSVAPAIHTVRCTNLAVFRGDAMRKHHIGRVLKDTEDMIEVFSDRTRELADAALWAQVADLVTASLDGSIFERLVEQLKAARGQEIKRDPVEVVEILQKRSRLTDDERGGILRHLVNGGELSRYGLSAAVTRYSQDVEGYERATELEELGAEIIELPRRDWTVIAEAA